MSIESHLLSDSGIRLDIGLLNRSVHRTREVFGSNWTSLDLLIELLGSQWTLKLGHTRRLWHSNDLSDGILSLLKFFESVSLAWRSRAALDNNGWVDHGSSIDLSLFGLVVT